MYKIRILLKIIYYKIFKIKDTNGWYKLNKENNLPRFSNVIKNSESTKSGIVEDYDDDIYPLY